VGHQHPFSYTNYSPANGWGEGHNTLLDGHNQQGQFVAYSHNGQAAIANNHHNVPLAQGISHRYGKNLHNASQSHTWGQGNPVGQQMWHNYNPHQGNHETQFQNGTAYPRTHNFGPNSYKMQVGYRGGVQQQPPPNYLPVPQMDQFWAPTYQHQAHQYDNWVPYPYIAPTQLPPQPTGKQSTV